MANPIFKFEKAKRIQLKAAIMIEGLSGKGKSGLGLRLAYFLAGENWDDVGAIDTENKSLDLFADLPFVDGSKFGAFNVGQLTEDIGFKPSNYLAFREVAIKNGNKAILEDSISHAWQYKGGVLDMVSEVTARSKSNDKYGAWRDENVAAEKNNLLSLLRDPHIHVITTVRVKEKFDYEEVDGRKKLVSLGEQQIQQGDLKYEPDLVLRMVKPGNKSTNPIAEVVKSRYAIFEDGQQYEFTADLCRQLRAYLEEGADPEQILAAQKQEYVNAITEHLNTHPNKKTIWPVMKEDAGFKDTKLPDIPLDNLKKLWLALTTD
jgi:hypothetical protein